MISKYENVGLELIDSLREYILGLWKSGVPSYPSMNVDGWKTDEQFFEADHLAVKALKHDLYQLVGYVNFSGWAMVNTQGCQHPRHQHTNVLLSGVYYVDPGDPPTPTEFDLEEFDTGRARVLSPLASPGTLITFSEGVWHYVPVYRGTRPRITIVLNAKRQDNP